MFRHNCHMINKSHHCISYVFTLTSVSIISSSLCSTCCFFTIFFLVNTGSNKGSTKSLLKAHYVLAKCGMKRQQINIFDSTTSREQLIYECIVNQLLRACLSGQTNNCQTNTFLLFFTEKQHSSNVLKQNLVKFINYIARRPVDERCFYHWIIGK